MRIHFCALALFLAIIPRPARAQLIDREAFDFVDSIVRKMGPMRDSNLAAIVREASASCQDEVCRIRGMFMWITRNVDRDCTPGGRLERTNGSASYTFRERRGTSAGFASLMSEMCRMSGIHCEMTSGLVKTDVRQIGNMDEQSDLGYWNIVRANGRWFVLDAFLGAGECQGKSFVRKSTDAWFFTNRRLFSLSHLPAESRQQLVDSPRSRPEFLAGPVMGPISAILGVLPMPDQRGTVRGRADSTVTLRFQIWPASMMERIGKVEARCDGSLHPADFESADDTLIVHLPLLREGSYELGMYINGEPAWAFQAQVAPALRRRKEAAPPKKR